MYNDLKLVLDALRQPFCQLVLVISFAGTLLLFMALAHLLSWGVAQSDLITNNWLEMLASLGSGLFVMVIGWFLFPVTMTAIACLFLDAIVLRMERHYYPDLPTGKDSDWADATALSAKTLWRALMLNLLVLPFYFIPIVNIAAYAFVNAKLLGHEYFYALALRHLSLPQAEILYEQEKRRLFRAGLKLAILFLIPGINLIAPILATSLMLHQLERRPDGPLRQAVLQAILKPGVN